MAVMSTAPAATSFACPMMGWGSFVVASARYSIDVFSASAVQTAAQARMIRHHSGREMPRR
jgi:hypothetical protein